MTTGNTNDPNNISFMYDELINESENFEIKRKVNLFDLGFIVQIFVLMAGPIPGFDMYFKFYSHN